MDEYAFLSIAIALDERRAQLSHDVLRMVVKWCMLLSRYTGTYFTLKCGVSKKHIQNRVWGIPVGLNGRGRVQLWLVSWTLYEPRSSLPLSTISFSFPCIKSARSNRRSDLEPALLLPRWARLDCPSYRIVTLPDLVT